MQLERQRKRRPSRPGTLSWQNNGDNKIHFIVCNPDGTGCTDFGHTTSDGDVWSDIQGRIVGNTNTDDADVPGVVGDRMVRNKRLLVGGLAGSASLILLGSLVSKGIASTDTPTPQVLAESATGFFGNIRLVPPPKDLSPAVSSDEAVSVALTELDAESGEPTRTTLAAFSWSAVPVDENDKPTGPPLYTDVPVWVVTVQGVCGELSPDTGECIDPRMNVIVDATAGKPLVAFPAEQELVGGPISQ